MDYQGARIMESLNERAGGSLSFFGLGGDKMVKAGLETNLADLSKLPDKPLYIFKNAHPFHRERLYAIYMIATRFKNWKVVRELEKELYTEIFTQRPDAIISLGNEYFMKRLFLMVDKKFGEKQEALVKPPMVHFDRLMAGQYLEHDKYLDHFFYSVPFNPPNINHYTFPSTCVGSQGLFDAYSYLYSRNAAYKDLVDKRGISLDLEHNSAIMEELVAQSRASWREKHSIPEEKTVIFFSPGSDAQEMKWSGAIVAKAVEKFLAKFSKVSADNFAVVVSVPRDMQDQAALLMANKWKCRVIVVTEREDRFGAMSVSEDYAGERLRGRTERRLCDRGRRNAAPGSHPGQDGRLAHLLDASVQHLQQRDQHRSQGRSLSRAHRHGLP